MYDVERESRIAEHAEREGLTWCSRARRAKTAQARRHDVRVILADVRSLYNLPTWI